MKPLFILIVAFLICLIGTKLFTGIFDQLLSGRIAMSVMLLFTAIGHFVLVKGMSLMMPSFLPFKKQLVYLTGLIEIAAAIGLLIPDWHKTAGWLLIIFFILILPANVKAAVRHVDYEKGTYEGPGAKYLWFRIPLQILFIAWVYWFSVRH